MAGYRFEALDADGRLRRGVLEVDSPRQARALLREQGLWAAEIHGITRSARSPGVVHRLSGSRARLRSSQLSLLMRQFATLISANLSLEHALNALVEQADTQDLRIVLAGVRGEVLAGQSLARAMQKFPRAFPEMYRTLISAGERSGQLAQVMNRLADYAEQRHALRSKVGLVLVYPAIVSAVAAAVIVVLLTHVVPQVVGVFQQSHQTLPFLTRALIATSDFVKTSGYYWLAAAGAAALLAYRALKQPALRFRFDALLLRLPVVGPLVRAMNAARFASTLAILVQSGVPVLAAMRAAAGVVTNRPMQRAVEQTERMLGEGASLSKSLARTQMFPPLMVHLVASGESSGELGAMLERAALNQTRELEHRVAVLTSLFEPLLILIMGGVVLLIVLATLLPIIELNQVIR